MFRKLYSSILAVVAFAAFMPAARAQLIVSDGFDYAPGAITGDNGGSGWEGKGWTSSDNNNPDQVVTGGLTFSSSDGSALAVSGNMLTTVGNDVGAYRQPPTDFGFYGGNNNQDVWVSFLAKNTGDQNGYGGLSLFLPGSNEQFFTGELSGTGLYGFQNNSLIAAQDGQNDPQATNTAADGTTHFLVADFNFTASGTTTVTLYVDPKPGTADSNGQPTQFTDTASDVYQDSFQFGEFRFQSGGSTNSAFGFDELRMGSSYLDVAPLAVAPAPEPSTGLIWLVGVGGLVWLVRRRGAA